MKRVLLVALVFAVSASLVTSILRGEPVSIHSHPHLVVVQYSVNGEVKRCGGSIISQNWILTSADCMFDITRTIHSPSNVKVIRGYKRSHLEFIPIHQFNVAEIIPHNQFTWSNYADRYKYNLGLVRLETSINFASGLNTVKLADRNDQYSSSECVVAGWNSPSYELHQVTVALRWERIEIFSSRLATTETDLGYPVLCPTSSGDKIRVAVVVGNTENYSMFASVSLEYQWIQQYVPNEFLQPTSVKPWETSENRPSGSAQDPSPHQHSGSQPNLSGHQHSESHQRPPSLNNSFHAHLVIVKFKRGTNEKRCSGSVINRQYVLTAAHCFYFNSSEMFDVHQTMVYGGFHMKKYKRPFGSSVVKNASQFIPHEEYRNDSPERAKYDIGMVRFGYKVHAKTSMIPITLADSFEKLDLNRCSWAGWSDYHHTDIVNPTLILQLSETRSPQIFTSPPVFPYNSYQNQGGPVLCPTKSDPKHLEQVAVAIVTNLNGYRYLEVPFHLRWIQSIIGS